MSELKIVLLNAATGVHHRHVWGRQRIYDLAVRQVEIAKRPPQSRVPEVTARGRFLAPQAISAVDVSTKSRIGILFDKSASGTRYEENQIEGFATPISDLSKKQNIDL